MIDDIRTMIWKESHEFMRQRGTSAKGMLAGIFVPIFLLGVFLPLQAGERWVTQSFSLIAMGWMPLFMAITMIADSFAGERERHTLETLLATRLSDQAILIGKIAVAVLYSWGMAVASLITGLITVNLAHWHGRLLLFAPRAVAAMLIATFLLAILASCAGVLVSLKSATVRQAAQTLSYGFLAIILIVVFGARVIPQEWSAKVLDAVAEYSAAAIIGLVAAILIAIDAALYLAARSRFQRSRLILD